jgi:hypothetical protein
MYKIMPEKPQEKRAYRSEVNIKMYLRKTGYEPD